MTRYNKFKEEYKKGLTQRESLLISALARQDKKIFSIEDARAVTDRFCTLHSHEMLPCT
jgi:hypothetical protein